MSIAKVSDMLMGVFGKRGGLIIDDTTAHTGNWVKVLITEDTIFATFTAAGWTGTITGITFTKNAVIHADITAITLTSGSCMAFNR